MKSLLLYIMILSGTPAEPPTYIQVTAQEPGFVSPVKDAGGGALTCPAWARRVLQGLYEDRIIPAANSGRVNWTATCENSL